MVWAGAIQWCCINWAYYEGKVALIKPAIYYLLDLWCIQIFAEKANRLLVNVNFSIVGKFHLVHFKAC
jgi:hypothetical protein